MASIGILVDDNSTVGYAYKILVPSGTLQEGIINLSNPSGGPTPSFMDDFYLAKANADSVINEYTDGVLVSQEIIKGTLVLYTVVYQYTSNILTRKIVSKATGGSVELEYLYSKGELIAINQYII